MPNPTNDVTAIANYAGTYSQALIGALLNGLDIAQDIYVMRNVKGPINLTKLTVTKGIRPLDTSIDDIDATGRLWSGRQISVKPAMKLFKIIPEELRKTWMSEMLDPNATREPFAQWCWSQEFATVAEEINESVFYAEYHGDASAFNAGSVYTAGNVVVFTDKSFYKANATTTAGQSPSTTPGKWDQINASAICDGLGTIIKNEITGGGIKAGQVIATNTFDNTNTVAELRKLYLGAPVKFRSKKAIMYISPAVMELYRADYDTRYGKGNSINDNTEDSPVIYLKGTQQRVLLKECTWMGASQRVIYTFDKNLVMATDQLDAANSIGKLIETLHGYKAIMKYLIGFQIQDLEVLYVNDKL
jgi:hypothetical protein